MPTYRVGISETDITPPSGVNYLAFAPRHQPFTGVHDRLFARATVVGDGPERVVVLAVDSIGFARHATDFGFDFVAELRLEIERRSGINGQRVMLACTHAHSTPATIGIRQVQRGSLSAKWLTQLTSKLATLVEHATANTVQAELVRSHTTVPGIAVCRRGGEKATVDEALTVVGFRRTDQSWHCVWLHFACHPVTVQVQPLVSADFPGMATEWLGTKLNCPVMYLQGAAADVNPKNMGFAAADKMGKALGQAALAALRHATAAKAEQKITVEQQIVELPARPLPTADVASQMASEHEVLTDQADSDGQQPNVYQTRRYQLGEQLARCQQRQAVYSAEVQVIRIGPITLAAVPGEPFSVMGMMLKENHPGALCVGYANDWLGYLAPPEAWQEGGYEVSLGPWSLVGPEAHGNITQTAKRLIASCS